MTTTHIRRSAAALACVLAIAAAGCGTTTISRLLGDPQRYSNHNVGLRGDVVESMSLLGNGAYKLDDGTGTIWVVSRHGVPRRGARVSVKGKVRDVVDVSTIFKLPDAIGSGLVMVEDHHRAH
jgi:hypothetical protein